MNKTSKKIAFGIQISFDVVMSVAVITFALWAFQFSAYKVSIAMIVGLICTTCIWGSKKLGIYNSRLW